MNHTALASLRNKHRAPMVKTGEMTAPTADTSPTSKALSYVNPFASTVGMVGSLAGTGLGAYHGYKRNHDSIGWGIGWGLLGGAFWPIALPVMFAQGLGEAK